MYKSLHHNAIALLAGLVGFAASVSATVYTWTSTSSTDWSSPGNWSGGNVPTSLSEAGVTGDSIVFSGTVLPLSNIPNYNSAFWDTIPMVVNSGGTLSLDFSSNFNSSMWANASRTQLTVGDGTNAVTVNINNMAHYARNAVDSTYQVNAGSTLNINGNLADYPDADINKNGVFNLDGGTLNVSGYLNGRWNQGDDNLFINFQANGGQATAAYGGAYNTLSDVTDDFGTVFEHPGGNGFLSALDNGDGTFSVTGTEWIYTWTSTSGTDWSSSGNWSGGNVPALLSDTATSFLGPGTDARIVLDGTVMPLSNIPNFGNGLGNDTIPMEIRRGGTLNLDFSSNFNSSMWAQASRTQLTVGDGTYAVTLTINNMTYYARNGFTSRYRVNAGSTLQFNGNLADYPDGDLSKQAVFELNGGAILVTGTAAFDFDTSANVDITHKDGTFTMGFGGPYTVLADVTADFGTVFQVSVPGYVLRAVDNGDGTFTVSVVAPGTVVLIK